MIIAAARKNRIKQFVVDGEAVVLGVDGVAEFQRAARTATNEHRSISSS